MSDRVWTGDPVLTPLTVSARLLRADVQRVFDVMPFKDAAQAVGWYELYLKRSDDLRTRALLFRTPEGVRVTFPAVDTASVEYLMTHYGIEEWALIGGRDWDEPRAD